MIDHKILVKDIKDFLHEYAKINYKNEYTGPDPYQLQAFAERLDSGIIMRCWSEWSSGCYTPQFSEIGRKIHDELMEKIYKIIRSK